MTPVTSAKQQVRGNLRTGKLQEQKVFLKCLGITSDAILSDLNLLRGPKTKWHGSRFRVSGLSFKDSGNKALAFGDFQIHNHASQQASYRLRLPTSSSRSVA
jgi:hypothetical protein